MPEDCSSTLRELETYLDGESPAGFRRLVSTHLERCEHCSDRAEFERHVRALVATRCRECAPSGLMERVVDQLRLPS